MAERSFTVEDVLRMIQIVKRDVEYLKGLEAKWAEQKKRFPVIYEGILKQQDALRLKASKLRTMKVVLAAEEVEELATQLLEGAPEAPSEELKPEVKAEEKAAEAKPETKPSEEKKSITDFAPAEVKPTAKAPDIGRGGPSKPSEEGKKEGKEEKEDLALKRRRLGIRAR
ncbi:MAG: hypothetical protein N2234_01745 [Planctomycetota bacterium]|nr:hypothetical protein [Planctomycetota bacterium]